MSAVTDTTVYQVDDVPTDRLIAMRAAPDQDTQFLLFLNLAMDFPAALCDFADSANPPSQEDCP
jgi:hypothetical protein